VDEKAALIVSVDFLAQKYKASYEDMLCRGGGLGLGMPT
jgi:hypothetical protein